jgi:hypothetical protein
LPKNYLFASEFCYHGLQIEGALYVCELCLKHGKSVGSVATSENGKTQAVSSEVELKTVSPDTKLSSQLPWSHGKVCNLHHFK